MALTSLNPGTKYYYKAFVMELVNGQYVERTGAVKDFTTTTASQTPGLQYLGGYEIPALSLANTSACTDSGTESGIGPWWQYKTTNSKRMVVTHAYTYNGKLYRNYTTMVDSDKKAPIWTVFVMHDDAYPDNNAGRNDSWRDDPGVPSSWQQGGVSGYSRGHLVASNYRQANVAANKQTFYHTNQAPQYQNGFNDGVWNTMEQAIKANAPSGRDTLYVAVGVLYEGSKTSDGVPVPSHFYTLLMKCSFNASGTMTDANGCAYIFTNEAHAGMKYSEGLTTIDAIESRSGFDFFVNVPDSLENKAEAQSAGLW